jgi:integration host factor subunit alpha
VIELFKTTLQKGEPVSIAKFGVFMVRSKSARRGRNPYTGSELMISSRRVVVFRASPQLKAAVGSVEQLGTEGLLPRGKS